MGTDGRGHRARTCLLKHLRCLIWWDAFLPEASLHYKNNTASQNQNAMCLFWSLAILTDARQNTQNVYDAKKSQVHQCKTTRREASSEVSGVIRARPFRLVTRSCKLTRCVNQHTQHRSSYRLNNSNQSWKELFLGKNAALPENINKKRERVWV